MSEKKVLILSRARLIGGRGGGKGEKRRSQGPEVSEACFWNCSWNYSAAGVEAGWWRRGGGCCLDLLLAPSHLSRVDLVVHSLKDLPTVLPPGFTIGAVCKSVSSASGPRGEGRGAGSEPGFSLWDWPSSRAVSLPGGSKHGRKTPEMPVSGCQEKLDMT